RARRVAPGVAAPLRRQDPQRPAHLGVQPLRLPLGYLHAEAVDVELLGELARLLQPLDGLGDLRAGSDGLDRRHGARACVERAVAVGLAVAAVARLAREDESLELARRLVCVEH